MQVDLIRELKCSSIKRRTATWAVGIQNAMFFSSKKNAHATPSCVKFTLLELGKSHAQEALGMKHDV
jgi:hypothetical protein